jgi:hypothetical protein
MILSLSRPQFCPTPPLSSSLSLTREDRGDVDLPASGSHFGIVALTTGLFSSPLVTAATLGRAALSPSSLHSIIGTQGETLILLDYAM